MSLPCPFPRATQGDPFKIVELAGDAECAAARTLPLQWPHCETWPCEVARRDTRGRNPLDHKRRRSVDVVDVRRGESGIRGATRRQISVPMSDSNVSVETSDVLGIVEIVSGPLGRDAGQSPDER